MECQRRAGIDAGPPAPWPHVRGGAGGRQCPTNQPGAAESLALGSLVAGNHESFHTNKERQPCIKSSEQIKRNTAPSPPNKSGFGSAKAASTDKPRPAPTAPPTGNRSRLSRNLPMRSDWEPPPPARPQR